MQLGEFEPHLHAQFCVEVRQRLVEQKDGWFAHQRPTDRYTLALAAGKLGGTTVEIGVKFEDARRFAHLFVLDLPRGAGDRQRESDVLPNRHMRIERIGLEHHGDATFRRRRLSDVEAVDEAMTLGNPLKPCDHPQQSRLAAAGRPKQRSERPFLDGEAEIGDRGDGTISLRDLPELDVRSRADCAVRPPGAHPLIPADRVMA